MSPKAPKKLCQRENWEENLNLPYLQPPKKRPRLHIHRGKRPQRPSWISIDSLWKEADAALVLTLSLISEASLHVTVFHSTVTSTPLQRVVFYLTEIAGGYLFLNILEQRKKKFITWNLVLHAIISHLWHTCSALKVMLWNTPFPTWKTKWKLKIFKCKFLFSNFQGKLLKTALNLSEHKTHLSAPG